MKTSQKHIDLFTSRVMSMNYMYDLPVYTQPVYAPDLLDRLGKFSRILEKEFKELQDLIVMVHADGENPTEDQMFNHLTALSDLLGDIEVYCHSEAIRNGLNLHHILNFIMDSNDTKLGADGLPIKDADGKFLKGPNFTPPEPAIKAYLQFQVKHASGELCPRK